MKAQNRYSYTKKTNMHQYVYQKAANLDPETTVEISTMKDHGGDNAITSNMINRSKYKSHSEIFREG